MRGKIYTPTPKDEGFSDLGAWAFIVANVVWGWLIAWSVYLIFTRGE